MRRIVLISSAVLLIASAAHAIQVKPWPPQPPPDLTVGAYAVPGPAVIHCGAQTITVTITETNTGSSPTGPYTTWHFANGFPFCARSRASLNPGASATYTDSCSFNGGPCDCPPTSYTIPVFSRVDSLNVVTESNEGNNQSPTVIKNAQCP